MPTREHRSAVLRRYAETITNGDLEGVLALFADDASVEDPVGLPPITGAQRIREFYKFVIDGGARVTAGIIRTSAEPYMAAMPLEVEADRAGVVALVPEAGALDAPSGRLLIRSIDVMTFNDAGLIVQMRALWGAQNIEPV